MNLNVEIAPFLLDEIRQYMDVVEVVRCRDCKWYDKHDKRCKVWNHGVLSIGYCYRGEERDDEID